VSQLPFAIGLVVVCVTLAEVLFTMVLPRRPAGVERLTVLVNRSVRLVFVGFSRLARTYEGKDAILAPTAPVALIAQLLFWGASLVVGFGLMLMPTVHSLSDSLLQSLTAMFTVGAVHIGGSADTGIDIAVGAIWVVIVALQIAYLPALYGAFSRRRASSHYLRAEPVLRPRGPSSSHVISSSAAPIRWPDLYASWEEWAADVAESHTTYPIFPLFRSPEPWFSWLLGLLAVLDGAAMHLALAPSTASSNARLCLRMGFTLPQRIALTLGWTVDPDPSPEGPIHLTYEEFASAVEMLERVGFHAERTAEQAWPDFRGWRVNYESIAYRLADRLTAPPTPWSGPRRHLHSGPVEPRRPAQTKPGERRLRGVPASAGDEPAASKPMVAPVKGSLSHDATPNRVRCPVSALPVQPSPPSPTWADMPPSTAIICPVM
jgi:hypothetical protein